ncbi:hypothetical protein [Elizabethkingia miricola]
MKRLEEILQQIKILELIRDNNGLTQNQDVELRNLREEQFVLWSKLKD